MYIDRIYYYSMRLKSCYFLLINATRWSIYQRIETWYEFDLQNSPRPSFLLFPSHPKFIFHDVALVSGVAFAFMAAPPVESSVHSRNYSFDPSLEPLGSCSPLHGFCFFEKFSWIWVRRSFGFARSFLDSWLKVILFVLLVHVVVLFVDRWCCRWPEVGGSVPSLF